MQKSTLNSRCIRQQYANGIRRQHRQNQKSKIRDTITASQQFKQIHSQPISSIQTNTTSFQKQLHQHYSNIANIYTKGIFYSQNDLNQILQCISLIGFQLNQTKHNISQKQYQSFFKDIKLVMATITNFIKQSIASNEDYNYIIQQYIKLLDCHQLTDQWLKLSNLDQICLKEITFNYYIHWLNKNFITTKSQFTNKQLNQIITNLYNFSVEKPKLSFNHFQVVYKTLPCLNINFQRSYVNTYINILSSLINEQTCQRVTILNEKFNIFTNIFDLIEDYQKELKQQLYQNELDTIKIRSIMKNIKVIYNLINKLFLCGKQLIMLVRCQNKLFNSFSKWITLAIQILLNNQLPKLIADINYQNQWIQIKILAKQVVCYNLISLYNLVVIFPQLFQNQSLNRLAQIIQKCFEVSIEKVSIQNSVLIHAVLYNFYFWKDSQHANKFSNKIWSICIKMIEQQTSIQAIIYSIKSIQLFLQSWQIAKQSNKISLSYFNIQLNMIQLIRVINLMELLLKHQHPNVRQLSSKILIMLDSLKYKSQSCLQL